MTDSAAPLVTHNVDRLRYEVTVGDTVAGYTSYLEDEQGRRVFNHTVVDPAFEGRGLGKLVVEAAMQGSASAGITVVPVCPFVVHYLEKNDVAGLTVAPRGEDDGLEAAGNAGE